jgi:mersacidin/lichenicidin family type 2 lantibiotic
MSKLDIIRAWKDEEYRQSLSSADRSQLPQNPAGIIELTDPDMAEVEGGTITFPFGCDSFITICNSYITYCPIITITITAETEQLQ